MEKGISFIAKVSVVCVVFLFALLFWRADCGAENEAPVWEDFLGSSSMENVSPDLLVSSDELPLEGGDALNELMRSLIEMRTFDQDLHGLEGNYEVISEISGKLEEGKEVSRIRLIALRHEEGVYDRALVLEVMYPAEDPFIIPLPADVRGIQSSISTRNFVSRFKSEVVLTLNSGRWGERFLIIAVADRQGEVIFDTRATRIPNVIGRFLNDYTAEIIVMETRERALIDLSSRKASYNRRLVYLEDGTLRSRVNIWVDSYSKFEPKDVDHDGILEIKSVIDLSGAGRADRIAYVDATLKHEHGVWNVIDTWIAPAEDLSKIAIPIRIN